MKCPVCAAETKVLESRQTDEGAAVRRRRECLGCARRFNTLEKVEDLPLIVIKKGSRREAFNRNKIIAGLVKACEKRPVTLAQLEEIADGIERELRNTMDKEVASETIGEKVMEHLKGLDAVAYVRFASVYREFKDLHEFREQLEQLLGNKK